MLNAYRLTEGKLVTLERDAPLTAATWIDLDAPTDAERADVSALGPAVPTLEEMEEIEISNRLYREDGVEVMTIVLEGLSADRQPMAGPVTFMLSPERLVTVRHHKPQPFETFPPRADRSSAGTEGPAQLFLGLAEEIIARQADLLEGAGIALDRVSRGVYGGRSAQHAGLLEAALVEIGRQGELIGRVRLSLLTLGRALGYFSATAAARRDMPKALVDEMMRDMQALEVHSDFLSQRVALITDATLGMVNLAQNNAVKSLSVVAAVFLPPTLIASMYGMNFAVMPELAWPWAYPAAVVAMLASAIGSYLLFRWKRWL